MCPVRVFLWCYISSDSFWVIWCYNWTGTMYSLPSTSMVVFIA